MSDKKEMKLATQVYDTLCRALDDRKWKYDKDEEKLVVHFDVRGEDIPMKMIIFVDAERQLIRLISPMNEMSEEKRLDGAIAVCDASWNIVDGSFDYDISDGSITFRMTAPFRESEIGVELFQYLISCSCATVDKYNDQFLAIDKGLLSIGDFLKKGRD